tara:strand:- start:306 stop:521 length:216 start_codon:yes stop_codon:yes gene_type:complete
MMAKLPRKPSTLITKAFVTHAGSKNKKQTSIGNRGNRSYGTYVTVIEDQMDGMTAWCRGAEAKTASCKLTY